MTPAELRSLSGVHGALAWASVVVLLVAVVAAWIGRRAGTIGARGAARVSAWTVPLAAVLGVATFATGLSLHGPFQSKLRQRLFIASEALGWLFERKEHVAFGALVLSLSALFAAWAARALSGRALSGRRGGAEAERDEAVSRSESKGPQRGPRSRSTEEWVPPGALSPRTLEMAAASLGRAGLLALSGALLLSLLALGVSVAVSGRVRF